MEYPSKKSKKSSKMSTDMAQESANEMRKQGRGNIPSDVLGSYTGTPENGEVPEQDGDDL